MEITKKEDRNLIKEFARRRVYIILAIFTTLTFAMLVKEESDKLTHVIDDVFLVGGSLIIICLSYLWRKASTLKDLRRQHLYFTIIIGVMLLVQIIAIPIEISDKDDFGNDIPGTILMVVTLLNFFL